MLGWSLLSVDSASAELTLRHATGIPLKIPLKQSLADLTDGVLSLWRSGEERWRTDAQQPQRNLSSTPRPTARCCRYCPRTTTQRLEGRRGRRLRQGNWRGCAPRDRARALIIGVTRMTRRGKSERIERPAPSLVHISRAQHGYIRRDICIHLPSLYDSFKVILNEFINIQSTLHSLPRQTAAVWC